MESETPKTKKNFHKLSTSLALIFLSLLLFFCGRFLFFKPSGAPDFEIIIICFLFFAIITFATRLLYRYNPNVFWGLISIFGIYIFRIEPRVIFALGTSIFSLSGLMIIFLIFHLVLEKSYRGASARQMPYSDFFDRALPITFLLAMPVTLIITKPYDWLTVFGVSIMIHVLL